MSKNPEESSENRSGRKLVEYFVEHRIGKRDKDMLAISVDAVNHHSGNDVKVLILARTGEHEVADLKKLTKQKMKSYIWGLEKYSPQNQPEKWEHLPSIVGGEYQQLIELAKSGNWASLTFLRELLSNSNHYSDTIWDYAESKDRKKYD